MQKAKPWCTDEADYARFKAMFHVKHLDRTRGVESMSDEKETLDDDGFIIYDDEPDPSSFSNKENYLKEFNEYIKKIKSAEK